MFGEPGNRAKHRRVLEDTLQGAATIAEPGGKIELPYRWEASPVVFRDRRITEGP